MPMTMIWPKMFEEFNDNMTVREALAEQLCAWGNIVYGEQPPGNFYEVMERASKITGAFTSTECNDKADQILAQISKYH